MEAPTEATFHANESFRKKMEAVSDEFDQLID